MVVVASDVNTLADYAQAVLSIAETSLAMTDAGTPDRSYVTAAAPAFDCCPALIVHVSALNEQATSPLTPTGAPARRTEYGNVILVTYIITAIRCAANPSGADDLPSITAMEAVAVEVQQDGWALWNGLRHAVANGVLFDDCLGVFFDGGVPIAEQGGCVGWHFQIRASIPGIPNP